MKDINENRLTKFEFALGVTKVLEDFLEDDVQYNYVQHFYSDVRVRPAVLDEFEAAEARQKGQFKNVWGKPDDVKEAEISNGEFRNIACCGPIQSAKNPTIFPYYPLLPKDLVAKFGHDNSYEYADMSNTKNSTTGVSFLGFVSGPKIASPQPMQMSSFPPILNNSVLVPPWRA
jgi:hypothetical protein